MLMLNYIRSQNDCFEINTGSGFVIPGLYKTMEYETTQGKIQESGDCYHVLLYIEKIEDGFIEYGLATSRLIPGLEMTYLNHLQTFRKFIDYFETEGKTIINESSGFQIDISGIIGKQYLIHPEGAGDTIVPKSELQFLTAIETDPERAKSILTLTKREKISLGHYLTAGLTHEEFSLHR